MLEQEAYPAIWPLVDAQNSAIPEGYTPKIGEDLSEMWLNRRAKVHADR